MVNKTFIEAEECYGFCVSVHACAGKHVCGCVCLCVRKQAERVFSLAQNSHLVQQVWRKRSKKRREEE